MHRPARGQTGAPVVRDGKERDKRGTEAAGDLQDPASLGQLLPVFPLVSLPKHEPGLDLRWEPGGPSEARGAS